MTNTSTSKVADRAKGSTPSIGAPTSDNDKQTPLHLAVRNGKEDQDTLLHQAVGRKGQEALAAVAILLRLLEAKDSNEKTPLENSIKNGQKGITRILVDKNADVELVQAQGSEGRTSLHKAISSGHAEIARFPVQPKANMHPDCLDSDGRPTKRRFTREADVMQTTHDKQFIDCPKRNCTRKGTKGFTRKDHQIEHLRGYHGEIIEKRQSRRAYS